MNQNYDPLAAYSQPSLIEKLGAAFGKSRPAWLLGLSLSVAIACLYLPFLSNPLVFDDKVFFVEPTLKQYGTSWFHFDLRWFAYASFGWTYDLFGLDWQWYRIGNLILHTGVALLSYAFFARLFGVVLQTAPSSGSEPRGLAFAGALLFALHPVAVYGAAYLVERSIVMATLFGVAMLWFYFEGLVRESKTKWLVASAVCYFLAVFSKEHSVMLPGVALALTLLLHKPSPALVKRVWLPFVLFFAIALTAALKVQGLLGAQYEPFAAEMLSRISENNRDFSAAISYPLSIVTQTGLFFKYLLLWLAPYPGWLAVDLRQPFADSLLSWPFALGTLAFLAYPLLAARLLLAGGRKGLFGFGMLYPWILFLTEISSVRIQEPFVLYRSYLWMSGLPALLPLVWGEWEKRWKLAGLAAVALLLSALAWGRLDTFSSSLKLWDDVVKKNTDEKRIGVERGYNNRGLAYANDEQYPAAIRDLEKALSLRPQYADAQLNLGMTYYKMQRWDDALASYEKAIANKPESGDAYQNRGVVLLFKSQPDKALADFKRAAELSPWSAEALLDQGLAYMRMGQLQEALDNLNRAIRLSPALGQAYMNRGIVHAMLGRPDDGLLDFTTAVRLTPADAGVYYNRGNVLMMLRRSQDALLDFEQAIRLNPKYADAYTNRGGVYMGMSRLQDALSDFNRALEIDPHHENARLNRGQIEMLLGQHQEALKDYDLVLASTPDHARALLHKAALLQVMNRSGEAAILFKRSCELGERIACGKS